MKESRIVNESWIVSEKNNSEWKLESERKFNIQSKLSSEETLNIEQNLESESKVGEWI